jgi:hypothetical protein
LPPCNREAKHMQEASRWLSLLYFLAVPGGLFITFSNSFNSSFSEKNKSFTN